MPHSHRTLTPSLPKQYLSTYLPLCEIATTAWRVKLEKYKGGEGGTSTGRMDEGDLG
jgi:hypothetical protein